MKRREVNIGAFESEFAISPQYLARVIFVAALSFIFFLGMLFGFYIREQIGYFILSSAFLVVYLLTMFGWFVLRRQRLRIHEEGISYRRTRIAWKNVSGVEELDPRSFVLRTSDGAVLRVSDAVSDWVKVREIVRQRTGF